MGFLGTQFSLYMLGASSGDAAAGGSSMSTFVFMGVIIAVFWFFMIRPQKQKQKQRETMLKALTKGDSVVSIGGIRGVVSKVGDGEVTVKVSEGCKIRFSQSAIADVVNSNTVNQSSNESKNGKEPLAVQEVKKTEAELDNTPSEKL